MSRFIDVPEYPADLSADENAMVRGYLLQLNEAKKDGDMSAIRDLEEVIKGSPNLSEESQEYLLRIAKLSEAVL